jgi:DNA primase
MSDIKDLLDYHIYPNLDRAEALADLDPRDKGSYYLLICPDCGKREAYIYKTGLYIKCNRMDKCAYAISLWDYIQQKRGLTNQETIQELAKLASYSLPSLEGYSHESAEKARKKANILEEALEFFKALLWTDKGKETREYLLKKRCYGEDEIKAMELGFNPGEEETRSFLIKKGYSQEEIKAVFKYLPWREDYKLVIPWRDPVGRLKSLWGRLVRLLKEGEKENDKYKPITEAEKGTLFNLHAAIGQKELRLVEGFLDALVAHIRGAKGVVGLGGDHLTKEQIENAKRYGVRQFTLCLDGDEAGQRGTEHALTLLNREGIPAFVAQLPEWFDPDDLIRENGIEAFEEASAKAISFVRWKAKRILSKHDLTTDKGKQDALLESLAFAETISEPLDTMALLETIASALGVPATMIGAKQKDYQEKKAKQKLEKGYFDLLTEAQRQLKDGKVGELSKFLLERTQALKIEYEQTIARPSQSFASRLKEQYQQETTREKGT